MQPSIFHHVRCVVSLKKKIKERKKRCLSKQAKFFPVVKSQIFWWGHIFYFGLLWNAKEFYILPYALYKSTRAMFTHVFILSEALCQICYLRFVHHSLLRLQAFPFFSWANYWLSFSSLQWTRSKVSVRMGHGHCPDTKREVMPEHGPLPFLLFYGGCCGWVTPAVKELTMWTFQPFSS